MRVQRGSLRLGGLVLLAVLALSTGCSYVENRVNDALDVMDLGILVSDHLRPDFGFFFTF